MWNSAFIAAIELTKDSLQMQPGEPVNPINPIPTGGLVSFYSWGGLLLALALVLLVAMAYAWLRPRTRPPIPRIIPPNNRPNERVGS